jgi:predicted Ser/Thr protein kinase
MPTCTSCGAAVTENGRFCSICGAALLSDDQATLEFISSKPKQTAERSVKAGVKTPSSSSGLSDEGRFLPGRLLAGRYRIVALLGKGGMGEVYRADDLTLGQPVALKFLPEPAGQDQALLDRFRNEVRISRRVSHANVCRVYDVGEVDGHTFFTMEYVDGEDLASLLRRIGRLPADKALEIARQLCAGLAAAHAKGVLHRDLKPANVMLDGRGQVVMTDFGLAGLIDQIPGTDVRSGTPAYMAPEQLAGKEVSVKTDIYSLGMVLYEIFTGKRAFDAQSLPDLVRTKTERTPSKPTSLVKDLDPVVERIIMRCLETDPTLRPSSVMNVAAALPGGDPLAAALAAGETPSPQMVAAAGETAGLAPRNAVIALVIAIAGLVLTSYLNIRTTAMDRIHLDLSPEVLSQKAKEIIQNLGYTERPLDSGGFLDFQNEFVDYVQKNDKPRPNWDQVLANRPTAIDYWYRQSPRYMLPVELHDAPLLTPGRLFPDDPPTVISGMINLKLDSEGHLVYFQAIPPQVAESPAPGNAVDWNTLFVAAGLHMSEFQSAQPTWASLADSDTRAAWTGTWPGTSRPMRIEAAAWRGKPVYFLLTGPWTRPSRLHLDEPSSGQKVAQIILVFLFLSILIGASWLGRRNYVRGRGDRQGAFRLAVVVFVLQMALWLCRGHFVPSLEIMGTLVLAISTGLFLSGLVLVLYLTLEPYIRRHWPQTIISWNRMLIGNLRDPLVGRDILYGTIFGLLLVLIYAIRQILLMRVGGPPAFYAEEFLMGGRFALGAWLLHVPLAIQITLVMFFVLLLFRVLLRNQWLAAIPFVLLWTSLKTMGSDHPAIEATVQLAVYTLLVLVVFRFGLVALATGMVVADVMLNVTLTLDFSAWYASTGPFVLLSVAAIAFWGFYNSLGGQKLLSPDSFT